MLEIRPSLGGHDTKLQAALEPAVGVKACNGVDF
jgi:hypothetical protein